MYIFLLLFIIINYSCCMDRGHVIDDFFDKQEQQLNNQLWSSINEMISSQEQQQNEQPIIVAESNIKNSDIEAQT